MSRKIFDSLNNIGDDLIMESEERNAEAFFDEKNKKRKAVKRLAVSLSGVAALFAVCAVGWFIVQKYVKGDGSSAAESGIQEPEMSVWTIEETTETAGKETESEEVTAGTEETATARVEDLPVRTEEEILARKADRSSVAEHMYVRSIIERAKEIDAGMDESVVSSFWLDDWDLWIGLSGDPGYMEYYMNMTDKRSKVFFEVVPANYHELQERLMNRYPANKICEWWKEYAGSELENFFDYQAAEKNGRLGRIDLRNTEVSIQSYPSMLHNCMYLVCTDVKFAEILQEKMDADKPSMFSYFHAVTTDQLEELVFGNGRGLNNWAISNGRNMTYKEPKSNRCSMEICEASSTELTLELHSELEITEIYEPIRLYIHNDEGDNLALESNAEVGEWLILPFAQDESGTMREKLNWSCAYGPLAPGQYKIAQTVDLYDSAENKHYTYTVFADFTVE